MLWLLYSQFRTQYLLQFLFYFGEGSFQRTLDFARTKLFERKNEYINDFILRRDSENFIKKITSQKTQMNEFLTVLYSWVRDAIILKTGIRREQLIHVDRSEDVSQFSQKYTFNELKDLMDDVLNASQGLLENLNIKIPLLIIKEKIRYG